MLEFRNLSLRRGKKLLFTDANFSLHKGERIGVIGANGVGKSSFFALIRQALEPDSGSINIAPNDIIAHVAQETPALDQSAVEYVVDGDKELREIEASIQALENEAYGQNGEAADSTPGEELDFNKASRLANLYAQYESISGYSAKSRAAQMLHGLGFSANAIEHSTRAFSGGWRMRLNLAQALMCRSDILLLDEPTNHLDLEAILWLEQWLLSYSGTLLVISHDRYFLDKVTTHTLHINNQTTTLYSGNYSHYETQRAEKLAQQQQAFTKQQREMAHMQSFIDRFRAKATKAKQAQSRLKALQRMTKLTAAHIDSPFNFHFKPVGTLPTTLLTVRNLTLNYQQAEKPILNGIDVNIGDSARIGLLGKNGAGKSTLIKALALDPNLHKSERLTIEGERSEAKALRIGYYAQHQLEQLDSEASPLTHLLRLDSRASEQALRDFLGRFNFHGEMATSKIAPMSGGEKARLALALVIYQSPNLLLLDEPTNHLDLEMRFALTKALQEFSGSLLVISHDRHLLENCCEQFWLVSEAKVEEFTGDLEDYYQWLKSHNEQTSATASLTADPNTTTHHSTQSSSNCPEPAKSNKKEQRQLAANRRKQLEPLKRALKRAETEMEKQQQLYKDIQSRLADPLIYEENNKEELKSLLSLESETKLALEQQEETWLNLIDEIENQEPD